MFSSPSGPGRHTLPLGRHPLAIIHCRLILSNQEFFDSGCQESRVKSLDEGHEVTSVKCQGSRVMNRCYIIAPLTHDRGESCCSFLGCFSFCWLPDLLSFFATVVLVLQCCRVHLPRFFLCCSGGTTNCSTIYPVWTRNNRLLNSIIEEIEIVLFSLKGEIMSVAEQGTMFREDDVRELPGRHLPGTSG